MAETKVPVPREAWPAIRAIKARCRLTNAEVADALGLSPTRVKQIVNNYESYRRPDGGWSVRKAAS